MTSETTRDDGVRTIDMTPDTRTYARLLGLVISSGTRQGADGAIEQMARRFEVLDVAISVLTAHGIESDELDAAIERMHEAESAPITLPSG